jgi:hypothetical protein
MLSVAMGKNYGCGGMPEAISNPKLDRVLNNSL